MTILVTGARGQLGREICRLLGTAATGVDVDRLDLTDGPATQRLLVGLRPEAVVNCAGYTQVDRAEDEPKPCRAVNGTAVGTLAEGCRRLDVPLVQISTDYVFGAGAASRDRPYREDDKPAPRGVYATSKFEGEVLAARWEKHLIVRTCGLYARPDDAEGRNFVRTMLQLADHSRRAAAEPPTSLRVVDDQRCTPSYVPHVARAVVGLLEARPPWGVYHVTNVGETTWFGLARELFRLTGHAVELTPITTAEYGAPAPRPGYSVLDGAKYHALAATDRRIPPMPDWREALGEYVDQWCRVGAGG